MGYGKKINQLRRRNARNMNRSARLDRIRRSNSGKLSRTFTSISDLHNPLALAGERDVVTRDLFMATRLRDPTSSFSTKSNKTFSELLQKSRSKREKIFFKARVNDPTSYFHKFKNRDPLSSPRKMHIELVPITWLKAHEEVVSNARVNALLAVTLEWNAYTKPLLVDQVTGAILDGHHRYEVGKRLALNRLPVVMVDYLGDPSIEVDVWPGCGRFHLTKRDVIHMSLSDSVFPPKTSRHRFADDMPVCNVPLVQLRQLPMWVLPSDR